MTVTPFQPQPIRYVTPEDLGIHITVVEFAEPRFNLIETMQKMIPKYETLKAIPEVLSRFQHLNKMPKLTDELIPKESILRARFEEDLEDQKKQTGWVTEM